jgi:hypothetical protein
MGEIMVTQVITIGIMVIGFAGNILYFRGQFVERLRNTEENVRDLKGNVRFKDTCDAEMTGLQDRVIRMEKHINGALAK